jgi:hypothetical protein
MKDAFSHIRRPHAGASVDELKINKNLSIPMSEIDMRAVRAQGAGGQNVNKVATAIHLRFDISNSTNNVRRCFDYQVAGKSQPGSQSSGGTGAPGRTDTRCDPQKETKGSNQTEQACKNKTP